MWGGTLKKAILDHNRPKSAPRGPSSPCGPFAVALDLDKEGHMMVLQSCRSCVALL